MNNQDTKFNTAIDEVRKVHMTTDEKNRIREAVLRTPILSPKSVKSTWIVFSWITMTRTRRVFSYVAISCLILILAGREAVFASEGSLPGDVLYPVKVSIVEPIESALKSTPVAKAQYESGLATKRMVEAETLAKANKLDEEKEKKINDLLENHTKALGVALLSVEKDSSSDDVDDIVTNFQAGMNAHAHVLDIIDSRESTKEVSNKKIADHARMKGGEVRKSFKKEKNDTASYAKRKDKVKSLIDSTTTDIDRLTSGTSPVRQSVIDTTHTTLETAKKLLDDASREDGDDDSTTAYSSLLDSESSAKEADIFLNVGLELNRDSGTMKFDSKKGKRNRGDKEDSNRGR